MPSPLINVYSSRKQPTTVDEIAGPKGALVSVIASRLRITLSQSDTMAEFGTFLLLSRNVSDGSSGQHRSISICRKATAESQTSDRDDWTGLGRRLPNSCHPLRQAEMAGTLS